MAVAAMVQITLMAKTTMAGMKEMLVLVMVGAMAGIMVMKMAACGMELAML